MSDMTVRLHFHFSLSCLGEVNGNPLQCSCLENPMDGGAWWAAVYGVAQSRTRLKRLSSSSSSAYVILDFIEILESLAMSCISFGKLSDNISSIIAQPPLLSPFSFQGSNYTYVRTSLTICHIYILFSFVLITFLILYFLFSSSVILCSNLMLNSFDEIF